MARGFESKAVTDQQESAQAPAARATTTPSPTPSCSPGDGGSSSSRSGDVVRHLADAHVDAHRQMLQRALRALDDELASLG
jgi:activator of HSP90 ATPase